MAQPGRRRNIKISFADTIPYGSRSAAVRPVEAASLQNFLCFLQFGLATLRKSL